MERAPLYRSGEPDVDPFDEAFQVRLEAKFWELAQRLLVLGTSVVLEWGFWARVERDGNDEDRLHSAMVWESVLIICWASSNLAVAMIRGRSSLRTFPPTSPTMAMR